MKVQDLFSRHFWNRARSRLFLLVLLMIVPVLAVQVTGSITELRQNIDERKMEVSRLAAHTQSEFEEDVEQARIVFSNLVHLNEVRQPDNCTQLYTVLRLAYERLAPEAVNIGVSDADGNITCIVEPVLGDRNIDDQTYFLDALSTLDMALGAYSISPIHGEPVLNIAYPVLSFNGQVQTVIFITYELQWLNNWQKEVSLPQGIVLTLIAPDGSILQQRLNGEPVEVTGTVLDASWYELLQDGQSTVEAIDGDGVRRLHTLAALEYDDRSTATLHLGYPVDELYTELYLSLSWKLALLGLTLIAVLGLSWWGSEILFLRPLRSLMQVVARVQAGDLQARASSLQGLSELTMLANDFDRMADALQKREEARQQAQNNLQESQERFRAVFDNTAFGVAVMSLDRHLVAINERALKLTGYSVEEMRSINPSLLAVEEDRTIDRDLFIELIEGKRDQYTVEKRYIRKDQSIFWGRVNFSAVRGLDGKPVYTIGTIEDISEEKQAAERLDAQEAEYRRMLEQRIAERTVELNKANELLQQKTAQDAVAAERIRLARELHDAVTQTLFSATLIADVLPEIWETNITDGRRRLAELHQLTRGALAEMRALLVELRPNALVEVPLPTLLRQLTEAVTGRARINVQLSVVGQRPLPADVQVMLYRITQEALNNIIKHSHATQAMVTLRLSEPLRLTIADNGAGFDPSRVTAEHLGLKIMRERADSIGAAFTVYSEPGEGAQISVIWE